MSELEYIEIDGYKLRYHIAGTGRDALVIGSALYYPVVFQRSCKSTYVLLSLIGEGLAKVSLLQKYH